MSAMAALSVSVHTSILEIPCENWNALLTQQDSPFVDWRFLAALEQSGCAAPQTGWTPCHLAVHRGADLVAVAPAYLKESSDGDFSRDWDWAAAAERAGIPYYPKLVFGIPFTPVTGRRILTPQGMSNTDAESIFERVIAAGKELVRRHGLGALQVLFLPDSQLHGLVAQGLCPRIDFQYHFVNPGYPSCEAFYARFSSKRRNVLRREMAAPSAQGITIQTLRYEQCKSQLSHYAALAHTLHSSTVEKLVWGRRWLNARFYSQLFEAMPEPLELVLAYREGNVIAGAFNVASVDRLFGRYWGCLEETPFLHFNVCLYHSIAECIERRTAVFEGGAGGEHKIARGFEPVEMHSAHYFAHPGFGSALQRHLQTETENRRRAVATWRQTEAILKPWPLRS